MHHTIKEQEKYEKYYFIECTIEVHLEIKIQIFDFQ